MKILRKISVVFVLMGLVALGMHLRSKPGELLPTAEAAPRAADFSHHGCNLETIEGSFGISSTGSIVAAGPVGPVADVGVITFDGDGGVSQTTTVSLNGTIIPNRASLGGSYVVNSDCTGDLSVTLPTPTGPSPSTSHFVIVHDAEQLLLVNTGTGRVITGEARKQHSRRW